MMVPADRLQQQIQRQPTRQIRGRRAIPTSSRIRIISLKTMQAEYSEKMTIWSTVTGSVAIATIAQTMEATDIRAKVPYPLRTNWMCDLTVLMIEAIVMLSSNFLVQSDMPYSLSIVYPEQISSLVHSSKFRNPRIFQPATRWLVSSAKSRQIVSFEYILLYWMKVTIQPQADTIIISTSAFIILESSYRFCCLTSRQEQRSSPPRAKDWANWKRLRYRRPLRIARKDLQNMRSATEVGADYSKPAPYITDVIIYLANHFIPDYPILQLFVCHSIQNADRWACASSIQTVMAFGVIYRELEVVWVVLRG